MDDKFAMAATIVKRQVMDTHLVHGQMLMLTT